MPEELNGPELPEMTEYLWQWFMELHIDRGFTETGPQTVSYQDIKAWADITHRAPRPGEVEAIKRLDYLYLRISSGSY